LFLQCYKRAYLTPLAVLLLLIVLQATILHKPALALYI
jgi:hypothetical protein